MKVCSNCGAEYQAGLDKCPYCGMSDSEAVQKQHKGKVNQLKKQRDYIKKLPDIIPKKSTRYLVAGGGILLVVFLLVLLLVLVGRKISLAIEENREEKNIAIMEEYLVLGEYEELDEFYYDIPHAYAVYDKYQEVVNFYSKYDFLMIGLDMVSDYGGAVEKELVLEDIVDSMIDLRDLCVAADVAMTDNSRLSNEQYIEDIKNMGVTQFKAILQVDDSVVEQVIAEPDAEGIPVIYEELAEQIYDNLDKENFGRNE